MKEPIFYLLNPCCIPRISLCDTAKIEPPYIHFRRQSSEYIFYFIHSGELAIRESERKYVLTAGDYILLDPSCEHEGIYPSVCSFTYIHFSLEGLSMSDQNAESIFTSQDLVFCKTGSLSAHDLISQSEDILLRLSGHMTYSSENSLYISGLLCELLSILAISHKRNLACAAVRNSRSNFEIQHLKSYLLREYSSDITSKQIEERFHCNFDYLNRRFKKELGDTIFSSLSTIRIENAKKYLATGLYTCGETAAKCGFRDVYYFSKVFKKHVGISPSAYRQSL